MNQKHLKQNYAAKLQTAAMTSIEKILVVDYMYYSHLNQG